MRGFDNKKDAENIAKKIVRDKLAACIQFSEVDSYYRWNSNLEKTHEYKLEIKTLNKNYKQIEELISKNHKYEIPELLAIKIKKGSKKYLNWIKGETK